MRQARSQGMRARSVFKLEQIDKKYNLIKPNFNVVDLGCSPGSWCQYGASKITGQGQIAGVDILPMNPIEKSHVYPGRFHRPSHSKSNYKLF